MVGLIRSQFQFCKVVMHAITTLGSNLVFIVLIPFALCGVRAVIHLSAVNRACRSQCFFQQKWRLVASFFLFVLFYVSGLRFDVNPPASVLCVYNCVCLCLWRSEIDILRVSSVFLNHSPPYFVCVHVWVRCVWHTHTRVDR